MRSKDISSIETKAILYRLFSGAFREPEPADPGDLGPLLERIAAPACRPPAAPPPLPADRRAEEMRRVFGHNLSPDCPPYETQYGSGGVFRKTQTMADLAGFYRAFGCEPAPEDRRPDHLPIQLEFCSLLCLKEARAAQRNETENISVCRRARARFLKEHLGLWIPVFAAALERKAPGAYYSRLARCLEWFISMDAASLGVEPAERRPELLPAEPPGPGEDLCPSCF